MSDNLVDIKENDIRDLDSDILRILLLDRTTGENIIWATDNYESRGEGYRFHDNILFENITGKNGNVIKPRVKKSKNEQAERVKKKAEVFTPAWVCNAQNNLVDEAWFGRKNVFNKEIERGWKTTKGYIEFPKKKGKTWQDYVLALRLEVSCGEAPYLTNRYDATNGDVISVMDRIGILDRKLRVVNENAETEDYWFEYVKKAYQSTYGFEWQGDNVLIARENMLFAFIDFYKDFFNGEKPSKQMLKDIAEIISWNIWQMDGIKYVIPDSCHKEAKNAEQIMLEDIRTNNKLQECPGCKTGNNQIHNGIYSIIKDWQENTELRFADMVKGENNYASKI